MEWIDRRRSDYCEKQARKDHESNVPAVQLRQDEFRRPVNDIIESMQKFVG